MTTGVLAAEPGPAIKATTILKARQTWDGTTTGYPRGAAKVTGALGEFVR